MDYEKAVRRLKTLRGHVFTAHLVDEEVHKASFNLEEIRKSMWKIIPEEYFQSYEVCSELKSLK